MLLFAASFLTLNFLNAQIGLEEVGSTKVRVTNALWDMSDSLALEKLFQWTAAQHQTLEVIATRVARTEEQTGNILSEQDIRNLVQEMLNYPTEQAAFNAEDIAWLKRVLENAVIEQRTTNEAVYELQKEVLLLKQQIRLLGQQVAAPKEFTYLDFYASAAYARQYVFFDEVEDNELNGISLRGGWVPELKAGRTTRGSVAEVRLFKAIGEGAKAYPEFMSLSGGYGWRMSEDNFSGLVALLVNGAWHEPAEALWLLPTAKLEWQLDDIYRGFGCGVDVQIPLNPQTIVRGKGQSSGFGGIGVSLTYKNIKVVFGFDEYWARHETMSTHYLRGHYWF